MSSPWITHKTDKAFGFSKWSKDDKKNVPAPPPLRHEINVNVQCVACAISRHDLAPQPELLMHNAFCVHKYCGKCFQKRFLRYQYVPCCWPGCLVKFHPWMFVWENEAPPTQPPGTIMGQVQDFRVTYASSYQYGVPNSMSSAGHQPPQAHGYQQAPTIYDPPQASTPTPVQTWQGQYSVQPSSSAPQSSAGFYPESSRNLDMQYSHDFNTSTDSAFEMNQYPSITPMPHSSPPNELARQESPPGPGNLSRAPTLFGHHWDHAAGHLTHHIPTCMYKGDIMGPVAGRYCTCHLQP